MVTESSPKTKSAPNARPAVVDVAVSAVVIAAALADLPGVIVADKVAVASVVLPEAIVAGKVAAASVVLPEDKTVVVGVPARLR